METIPFAGVVTSVEQLRTIYRAPSKLVAEKKMDHVPPWVRVAIEASRFAFIATADAEGRATVSPKGGADGFAVLLDDRHLAIPDYPGNNLNDSLRNIIVNPHVGLIFVVPGRNETIRVDGEAWVTTDPEVLERCRVDDGRRARSAIGVRVTEVFFHCPASFRRATLWAQESWREDASTGFDDFVRASLPEEDWPDWAR
jgi:PPOX class probable FMN-dependent enzyme